MIELGDDDDDDENQDEERSQTEDAEDEEEDDEGDSSKEEDEIAGNDDEDYNDDQHAEKKQKVDAVPQPKPKQSRKKRQSIPKKKKGTTSEYPDAPKFLTAYILFCKDKRPSLSHIKPNQILVELGKMWRAAASNVKLDYEEASKKTKKEREAWINSQIRVKHTFFLMKYDTAGEKTLCPCADQELG